MIKISNYKKKVAYWETDQMGVVHHSNYVKWMEEARLHFLREIGLSYEEIEKNNFMLPVYNVEITYKKPAKFAETIEIITGIVDVTEVKIVLEYKIVNKNNEILARGKTVHPFTNMELKIVKMPEKFYNHFIQYAKHKIKNNNK